MYIIFQFMDIYKEKMMEVCVGEFVIRLMKLEI